MKTALRSPALAGLALACAATWLSGCANAPVLQDPDLAGLRAMSGEIDQGRLMAFVDALGASHDSDAPLDCSYLANPEYIPYPICHLTDVKARALMAQKLRELGLQVSLDDSPEGTYATSNVIAELPGVSHPEEVILVGAHFDAFYEGADDNGTGASAVVELARVLSQHRFERTIRFIGFDLEEPGYFGSSRYLAALKDPGSVKMALIFDGLGYYSDLPGSQHATAFLAAPSEGDFVAVVSNDPSLPRRNELSALNSELGIMKLVSLISPGSGIAVPDLMRSDHAPFWVSGKQALLLTDTGPFRNPHYHRSSDLVETLDPARYTQAVQLSAAALGYWAGGPR